MSPVFCTLFCTCIFCGYSFKLMWWRFFFFSDKLCVIYLPLAFVFFNWFLHNSGKGQSQWCQMGIDEFQVDALTVLSSYCTDQISERDCLGVSAGSSSSNEEHLDCKHNGARGMMNCSCFVRWEQAAFSGSPYFGNAACCLALKWRCITASSYLLLSLKLCSRFLNWKMVLLSLVLSIREHTEYDAVFAVWLTKKH